MTTTAQKPAIVQKPTSMQAPVTAPPSSTSYVLPTAAVPEHIHAKEATDATDATLDTKDDTDAAFVNEAADTADEEWKMQELTPIPNIDYKQKRTYDDTGPRTKHRRKENFICVDCFSTHASNSRIWNGSCYWCNRHLCWGCLDDNWQCLRCVQDWKTNYNLRYITELMATTTVSSSELPDSISQTSAASPAMPIDIATDN